MKNCPLCKTPPNIDGFVSCKNKDCLDFDLKYLPHEWNNLIEDLEELGLIEEAINGR